MKLKNVFSDKHVAKLKEPLIQNFLCDDYHYQLFQNYVEDPKPENQEKLDHAFKEYYKRIKTIAYLNKLIYFFTIDYDKKVSTHTHRNLLSLDAPLYRSKDSTTAKENIKGDRLEYFDLPPNIPLPERIANIGLYNKWHKGLTDKQRKILSLKYECNFSNEYVAHYLNESKQTVSYNHKKAIEELRSAFDKESFYV